jgi:signal transduction histidine kinase
VYKLLKQPEVDIDMARPSNAAFPPSPEVAPLFWRLPGFAACLLDQHGNITNVSDDFNLKFPVRQGVTTLGERLLNQGLSSHDYARLTMSLAEVYTSQRHLGGDLIHFENPTQVYALYSTSAQGQHLLQFQPVTHHHQLASERTLLDHLLHLTTPVVVLGAEGQVIKRNQAFIQHFKADTLPLLQLLDLEELRQLTPLQRRYWHEQSINDAFYDIQLGAYPDANGQHLYYLVLHDVTDRVKAMQAQREAALGNLRQDLAHQLHDRVAQYLAFMQMKCAAWTDAVPKPQELQSLRQALQAALTETRFIINHLREGTSGQHPLTLNEVLSQAHEVMGLKVSLEGKELFLSLPMQSQLLLCAILFEALSNARRHGGTDRAWVSCETAPAGINLRVQDNGRGFDTSQLPTLAQQGHFGLRTIADRLRQQGGKLTIDSKPSSGTRLTVFLPLNPGEQ